MEAGDMKVPLIRIFLKKKEITPHSKQRNQKEMPRYSKKEASGHFDKGNGLESRQLMLRMSGENR